MTQKIQNNNNGLAFFILALLVFAVLGLELLLAIFIEPIIFSKPMNEFNTLESIIHWVTTCLLWGVCAYFLLIYVKKKYSMDIFANKNKISKLNLALCIALLIITVTISIIDWNGFKPYKEFIYNGLAKFIFQYIYYIVEAFLVLLIIIFGQKAGEEWFKNDKIPYGGILAAITWGLVHILTKGNILIGLIIFVNAILFGVVYLLAKKNIYISYPFILLMFIL